VSTSTAPLRKSACAFGPPTGRVSCQRLLESTRMPACVANFATASLRIRSRSPRFDPKAISAAAINRVYSPRSAQGKCSCGAAVIPLGLNSAARRHKSRERPRSLLRLLCIFAARIQAVSLPTASKEHTGKKRGGDIHFPTFVVNSRSLRSRSPKRNRRENTLPNRSAVPPARTAKALFAETLPRVGDDTSPRSTQGTSLGAQPRSPIDPPGSLSVAWNSPSGFVGFPLSTTLPP
jgi:hypothetical protein